ncbi:hypothetical protein [Marinobacter sp. NFXS9]|uniref:hypothetical protein n=1 Tax=Marinobacter sp. NFXS9 TaxID=2818433 RepID=UPI0032DF6DE7
MDKITYLDQFKLHQKPWYETVFGAWDKAGLTAEEIKIAEKKLQECTAGFAPGIEYETELAIPDGISESDRTALIESHKKSINKALGKCTGEATLAIAGLIGAIMLNSRRW